jgi:Na+/H+ antiporter NhaA
VSPPSEERSTAPRGRVFTEQLTAPLRRFIATEAGSAGLLLAATVVALVWANSPWSDSYVDLWSTEASVSVGERSITEDLRHWVNDGLMVFFFFVVGLEVRRELAMGELTDRRRARIPVVAAVAGIVIPAALFLALNPSGEAAQGWGVAISTDTAFVLGALALIGPACPTQLRVFLLTLAIVDDIAALLIIALFYSSDVSLVALAVAAGTVPVLLLIRRLPVWQGPAYFLVGLVLWVAMLESGVHPAIAGVVIALCVSAYEPRREEVERAAELARAFRQSPVPALARSTKLSVERAVSPNERLQELLHPWTSYLVVPLFALANAGIPLDGESLRAAFTSTLTWGIILGLVVGKLVGITLVTLWAVRLRIGTLPRGVGPGQLAGGAALAGIGFTVALFITDLAFDDPALRDEAKTGVLAASIAAALLGWLIFRGEEAWRRRHPAPSLFTLDPPVDPARDHLRGAPDAPLVLVEFGDFECPFCGRATGAVEEVRETLGDELLYVFRHLPLSDVHPHAELAAEAAEAAGRQGRFWEMHDRLYAHQDALGVTELLGHADALGLDVERFARDLESGECAAAVRDDVASAEASGAGGTPTFYIGGRRHTGAYDARTLIERLRAVGPG